MALTRMDLDAAGCETPNCGHDHTVLYLYSRCHGSAGQRVSYDKRTGSIRIVCRKCEAVVAEVAVAAAPERRALN